MSVRILMPSNGLAGLLLLMSFTLALKGTFGRAMPRILLKF